MGDTVAISKKRLTPRSIPKAKKAKAAKVLSKDALKKTGNGTAKAPVAKSAPAGAKKPANADFKAEKAQEDARKIAVTIARIDDETQKLLTHKVAKILSDAHVRQDLIEIGGENALVIVRNFYGNHSDEEFAKKLKIKISDVRATLNKLHNEGLVNYIREKDSETGWYSYSWSLNHDRMERWASTHIGKVAETGGDGSAEYYFCPSCGAASVTNFVSAATVEFRCERCNKLLEFIDEKKLSELYEKAK